MEIFYDVKNWIVQNDSVGWGLLAVVILLMLVDFWLSCKFYGYFYVAGYGLRKDVPPGAMPLGVVVSAGLGGFNVMDGPVHERNRAEFQCVNMLPWKMFLPSDSPNIIPHLEMFKKTRYSGRKTEDENNTDGWMFYSIAPMNWPQYLKVRKRELPLPVEYVDGVVSYRVRKNVKPVCVYINKHTAVSKDCPAGFERIDSQSGQELMFVYKEFNYTLNALQMHMTWEDFVNLGDGTYLHKTGIMEGRANSEYIGNAGCCIINLYVKKI